MRPPADRRLDTTGAGIDLPAPARPRYGVRWPVVFLVATMLGIASSTLAWQFTLSLGRPAYWRTLLVLNCSYWYLWAIFTPAIVWLSLHFRFERQELTRAIIVHVPSVMLFSFAHIALMGGVQHALRAFQVRALDYLLKPFDRERFTEALQRARKR